MHSQRGGCASDTSIQHYHDCLIAHPFLRKVPLQGTELAWDAASYASAIVRRPDETSTVDCRLVEKLRDCFTTVDQALVEAWLIARIFNI